MVKKSLNNINLFDTRSKKIGYLHKNKWKVCLRYTKKSKPNTNVTPFTEMSSFDQVLGALIIAVGAGVTVLGLNAMKFQQIKSGPNPLRFNRIQFCLFSRAFFCFGMGQLLMIAASYFATVSVCAATANIAVAFNAILASRWFGERFNTSPPFCNKDNNKDDNNNTINTTCNKLRSWDLGGVLVMLLGAAIIVVNAPSSTDTNGNPTIYNTTTEQIMLQQPLALISILSFGLGILIICGSISFLNIGKCSRVLRAVSFGLIAGCMGAYTFLPTKLLLSLPISEFGTFWWFALGCWGVGAEIILVTSLNVGMVALPTSSVVIVSTYYISSTIISSILGLSVFELWGQFQEWQTGVGFVFGMLLCFLGVYVVAYQEDLEEEEMESNRMERIDTEGSTRESLLMADEKEDDRSFYDPFPLLH